MTANRIAATVSWPSGLLKARIRNTGIPSSRRKPIALGTVHGFSGWSERVASGGGPERSIPNRRRLESGKRPSGLSPGPCTPSRQLAPELRHRLGGALHRNRAGLAAAADLDLDLAGGERPAPDRDPHRASQQLG